VPEAPPRIRREIELTIDGHKVSVPKGATIFEAARALGVDAPTLCYLESVTHP
jgi:NADH dehydrogenase/NADH:ubiquinone oxidoreductase subunit G